MLGLELVARHICFLFVWLALVSAHPGLQILTRRGMSKVFVEQTLQRRKIAVKVLNDFRRQIVQNLALQPTQDERQNLGQYQKGGGDFYFIVYLRSDGHGRWFIDAFN